MEVAVGETFVNKWDTLRIRSVIEPVGAGKPFQLLEDEQNLIVDIAPFLIQILQRAESDLVIWVARFEGSEF